MVTSKNGRAMVVALVVTNRVSPEYQGMPTNGRSSSVTLATSVQTLLDRMKRRKFSMPRPLCWRGDVSACNPFQPSGFAEQACRKADVRSSNGTRRSIPVCVCAGHRST